MKMRKYSKGFLRIAFFISRPTHFVREWFRGTMLYARHNQKWFVRAFELGNGITEALLDFGSLRPDGIIACGVPARFLQRFFSARGMGDVPIISFPQNGYAGIGVRCVSYDAKAVVERAIALFKLRGCRHVVYVGAHLRNAIRSSRLFATAFAAEAKKAEISFTIPVRRVYSSIGIRVSECDEIFRQLAVYPKPCGILCYDDGIGRDILDLCRLAGINVPGSVYVLGIGDNELICENSSPTLSSIELNIERTAFCAAQILDERIKKRNVGNADLPPMQCTVKGVVERASTQDPNGAGRLVSQALDFISKNACREGGIDQQLIANHLGVSLRTLQMHFKRANPGYTLHQEIQRVQLAKVRRLLRTSNLSISEITFRSGFGSLSRLKALFQEKFGMSMRDFRKSITPPPPHTHTQKKKNNLGGPVC